jgi:hypothetical protein
MALAPAGKQTRNHTHDNENNRDHYQTTQFPGRRLLIAVGEFCSLRRIIHELRSVIRRGSHKSKSG